MNNNKKIDGKIVSNTLQIAPFKKYYQWIMLLNPHASTWLQFINIFVKKMIIFRFF